MRVDTTRSLLRRPMFKPNALPWHSRAWDFFDANADLHRGYTIKANTIARVRMFGAWQANPDDEPVPLDEALASDKIDTGGLEQWMVDATNDALFRVQAHDGGQPEIQRLLALNLDVPGDGWLLGRDDGLREDWMVYSVEQVKFESGGWRLYDSPGSGRGESIGPDDILIRIWRKHPRFPRASDSAFRALLDLLEQQHLLSAEVTAAASSRLAGAGVWLLDSRIDVPQKADQEGAYNTADGAFETLLEAGETALRDPSSAAAAMPIVFQGEPPDGTKISDMQAHLTFERPLHEATVRRSVDLRREIIDGADFPPEWVMGLGNTSTYANARVVTAEGYVQDVDPTALLIANGIGTAWVRPTIETAGVPAEIARKIVVWRDPDSVISKPDRAKHATEAANVEAKTGRPIVSDESKRAAWGFDEGDAPSDEELEAAAEARRASTPALPAPDDSEEGPNADAEPVTASLLPPPIALGTGQPTEARLARASSRLVQVDATLTARLQTAGDRAVVDGLNRAGAQLRAKAQGSKALKAKVQGVPNCEVFAKLGADAVALASEADLLDTSLAVFEKQYDDWTAAAQASALSTATQIRRDAYSPADVAAIERQQQTDRSEGWAWLAAALLALMRGRLHDPTSAAPDIRGEWDPSVTIPYGYFRSAVAIAGGSTISRASGTGAVLTQAGTPAGGIGTGELILGSLSVQAGITTGTYIWLHGGSSHPLAGHEALDQVEFASWEDPVLSNGDSWPATDFYYISDHDGCSCVAEHVLVVD